MIKLVVYDCDGVLVDSDAAIIKYYTWMAAACGVPPSRFDVENPEVRSRLLSNTELDILEYFANGDIDFKNKMIEAIKRDKEMLGYKGDVLDFTGVEIKPNIIETLDKLKKDGYLLAVNSNRGNSLPHLLEHFGMLHFFSLYVCSAHDIKPKPAPDGLYHICESLSVDREHTIFIGDSAADYYAAKNANIKFLAYEKELFDAEVITQHLDIYKYF